MSSQLQEAIIRRDGKAVEEFALSLEGEGNWSLVTIIDDLLPLMLMESNVRYGNFHSVKMNLFFRRLALEGYFSKTTEIKLARLITREMVTRKWVSIHAERLGYFKQSIFSPLEKLIEEIDQSNVHNAFYYAIGLIDEQPEILLQTLLTLGARVIPKTLGHSLTCFFPVVEDIISLNHPQADSALLSYIMYLCRYDAGKEMLQKEYGQAKNPLDYNVFLKLCASGDGIVNLHHMITFYIATEWENASFNKDGAVPYGILLNWAGEKKLDEERERRLAKLQYSGKLPKTYEEFSHQFSCDKLDDLLRCILQLLEERPKVAVDWLFRLYASCYTPEKWDPHYYTGLYAALGLYKSNKPFDKIASGMASEQAICYFAQGLS